MMTTPSPIGKKRPWVEPMDVMQHHAAWAKGRWASRYNVLLLRKVDGVRKCLGTRVCMHHLRRPKVNATHFCVWKPMFSGQGGEVKLVHTFPAAEFFYEGADVAVGEVASGAS